MVPERFILASASPRRRELLAKAGYVFDVCPTGAEETETGDARTIVRLNAEAKARASAAAHPGRLILSADTLVSLDGVPLGKPYDADDAARMLRSLSGRAHDVYTGVAVARDEAILSDVCGTRVIFRALTDREIADYISTGEPMDKAGAYAIQGGAAPFVLRFEGAYDNVIGLPVDLVAKLFDQFCGKTPE